MSYNVENVFDTYHDTNKWDYEYLPLHQKQTIYKKQVEQFCRQKASCIRKNWDRHSYMAKIKNLRKVIASYDNGKGPDILVLEEIENKRAIVNFINLALKDLGYKYYGHEESLDRRGIDVAVISRIPIIGQKLHPYIKDQNFPNIHLKRGVLQTDFKINGKKLSLLGVHWPAQTKTPSTKRRIAAAFHLIKVAEKIHLNTNIILATGDFNTVSTESPNPINRYMKKYFFDALDYSDSKAKGSYFYKNTWSHFDRMFIYKKGTWNHRSGIYPQWKSYQVVSYDFMKRKTDLIHPQTREVIVSRGAPKRFNHQDKSGYSDHFPVALKIKF
jgi:endonuclease/exonuclease/phosphatase family metal-dependent hydrolase